MKDLTGVVWIIVAAIVLWVGCQYCSGNLTPEMKLAKKLEEGVWVMLDESWRDECQARNSYYSTTKEYYRKLTFYNYDSNRKFGRFMRADPDYEKMDQGTSYEINGDLITICWTNGDKSFRVLWQNEDIMGLQDPTDFNGPIRWYRRQ